MNTFAAVAILAHLAAAMPAPSPTVAAVVDNTIEQRATACTFTAAAAAIASKKACSSIVLKDITVPAGTTLDLTGLTAGTSVVFSGTTSFGYKEWEGPMISIAGTSISVSGASGHVIDGNGAKWWDGEGSNGGKTKPKFFYAHKMIDSTITGLNIKNHPVQCFSINGADNLVIDSVTIDNSAGDTDALGHNTDAYDVGDSSNIVISNTVVKNQDDCLAVNSGTVCFNIPLYWNRC